LCNAQLHNPQTEQIDAAEQASMKGEHEAPGRPGVSPGALEGRHPQKPQDR
jgi:hypothetical protein